MIEKRETGIRSLNQILKIERARYLLGYKLHLMESNGLFDPGEAENLLKKEKRKNKRTGALNLTWLSSSSESSSQTSTTEYFSNVDFTIASGFFRLFFRTLEKWDLRKPLFCWLFVAATSEILMKKSLKKNARKTRSAVFILMLLNMQRQSYIIFLSAGYNCYQKLTFLKRPYNTLLEFRPLL